MEDSRIPNCIFNGELPSSKIPQGCPQWLYKDICKRDMESLDISTERWQDVAANHSRWHCLVTKQLKKGEKIPNPAEEKRGRPKVCARGNHPLSPPPPPIPVTCHICFVWQGLPLPYQSDQPLTMLLQSQHCQYPWL